MSAAAPQRKSPRRAQARWRERPPIRLARALPALRWGAVAAAVAAIVGYASSAPSPARFFLRGAGLDLERPELRRVIAGHQGRSLFEVDLAALSDGLAALPGIAEARLSRRWPNSIDIELIADPAVATLNGDQVITRGRQVHRREEWALFNTAPIDWRRLPELRLPESHNEGLRAQMVAFFAESSRRLARIGIEPVALKLTEVRSLSLETARGMTIELCRHGHQPRLERLAAIWRAYLGSVADQIGRVNLCYPQGLAWQPRDSLAQEARP